MKKTFFTIVLISAFGSVFAQNLVVNGSFETETAANGSSEYQMNATTAPDGWTFTPSDLTSDTYAVDDTSLAEDGSWYVLGEAYQPGGITVPGSEADYDVLSQALQTVSGATYDFSYWVEDPYAGTGEGVFYSNATWNGTVISGTQVAANGNDTWTEYTGTVVGTGGMDVLGVADWDSPAGGYIDNVSLTQAVPEPLPIAVLGLGLLGLAIRRRR